MKKKTIKIKKILVYWQNVLLEDFDAKTLELFHFELKKIWRCFTFCL